MAVERKVPAIIDKPMNFCPGCGHGIIIRLIGECLTELGQDQNVIYAIGVGCSSNLGGGLEADRLHCCHGRAAAVATGMKRVNKENIVLTYQGDGDAYCIGIAESLNAAYRNENITVITINNTNFGMTGGQMSVTTMEGQKTSTSKLGRNCDVTGFPMKFPEMVASQFNVAYAARGSVDKPQNIIKLKAYIKNAIEAQMNGEGYSIVEVLSPCPINWGMTPSQSMEHIRDVVMPYFPIGVLKERGEKA
ncbi:thiamine pyrophosphate-dependent enzyme [Chakrabartyella piscis]|uniref:thiamine pyrophosphate-dependent enzyme n=1 Tax=Chakrabartyella piscis TaxID=2918914 RepID=UPI00295850EE|nr:thiamine pyrophosphate-dependent enzyme [Chakrabartyella piscis]